MLTARGSWFLIGVATVAAVAVLGRNEVLGVTALTLLLWFGAAWVSFAFRAHVVCRRLHVQRRIENERGPVTAVWAGGTIFVRTRLSLSGTGRIPFIIAVDRLPFGAELANGANEKADAIDQGNPLRLKYTLRCRLLGRIRLDGVGIRVADLCGFFYHAGFVPAVNVLRVLPPLVDAEGHAASVKRHNLLPPPGVHRFRRPGSGSELLDLRDYRPGDPPKTIAWKVSARRDRLITKEFESEVPIRCTLFVDASNSVRVGATGANALASLVRIAATVAQASTASRDLLGLCLFDQEIRRYIRPARGPRHLVQLLNALTDAAALRPTTGAVDVADLLPTAYSLAQEVYPHLLESDVNAMPAWVAALWPVPTYPRKRPSSRRGRIGRWVRAIVALVVSIALLYFIDRHLVPVFLIPWVAIISVLAGVALLAAMIGWVIAGATAVSWVVATISRGLGLLASMARGLRQILSPRSQRRARWRKQLAAVLSLRYGLAPGGLALLMEDDERFALLAQRFLAEHHVPYELPFYDAAGRYLFAVPEKVNVLSTALLRAAGRGHDNELFVLLADLLELTEQLDPLLRAVKIALARHHRVMIVCPWPPGLPLPRRSDRAAEDGAVTAVVVEANAKTSLRDRLRQHTINRFHGSFHRLRCIFARVGVPVLCADAEDPAQLILDRLDRLRGVGGKR